MPEILLAIPVVEAAAGGVVAGAEAVGLTISASSVVSTIGGVALSVGLSYVSTLLTKPSPPSQAQMVTSNESTAARVRGYGRTILGGARLAWENAYGSTIPSLNSSVRLSILAHCQGPIDAIEEYWFADEKAACVGGSPAFGALAMVATPMDHSCRLVSYAGAGSQAVSGYAKQAYTLWSDTDRARGLAYTVAVYGSVDQKDFLRVFKSGEPQLRVLARVSKVWDPRDSAQNPNDAWDDPATWAWSDNPGLCILDYLRHPDGRNKPLSRLYVQSFIDFANLCDQDVAKKHGGTEKRYRLGGSYSLMDEPANVMRRMLATCDAQIYLTPTGQIGIRGGQWVEPTLTFQGDAIIEHSLTQGVGKLIAFNRTAITYTSPAHDYQPIEAGAWIDVASEAAVGTQSTSLDLDMVQSPSQARRLAKINAAKSNPQWKGQIVLDVTGLNAITEWVIRIILPEDDLDLNEVFMILKAAISQDLTRVTLDVVSLSADAYAWTPETEEGEAPPIVPVATYSSLIPTPTVSSITAGGASGASSITVAVAPPADATLRLVVRWAPHGTTDYDSGYGEAGVWNFNTGVIADGATYDVQCWFASTSTIQGAMSAVRTVTIAAGVGAPGAPTGLGASNASGSVTLSATAPASSNVSCVKFWRTSGTSFTSPTPIATVYCAPAQAVVATDAPGSGTWRYWATAESTTGSASSPVGPQSVTV